MTYVSSASPPLDDAELHALLERSREWNGSVGITGMLLYCDGNFIQCLEGPRTEVRRLFAHILVDRRHRGVMVLVEEPITGRRFPEWSMGFHRVGQEEARLDQGYSDFLDRDEHGPESADSAHRLLMSFKQTMR